MSYLDHRECQAVTAIQVEIRDFERGDMSLRVTREGTVLALRVEISNSQLPTMQGGLVRWRAQELWIFEVCFLAFLSTTLNSRLLITH